MTAVSSIGLFVFVFYCTLSGGLSTTTHRNAIATSNTTNASDLEGQLETTTSTDNNSTIHLLSIHASILNSVTNASESTNEVNGNGEGESSLEKKLLKCGVVGGLENMSQTMPVPKTMLRQQRPRTRRQVNRSRQDKATSSPLIVSGGDVHGTMRYVEVHLVADNSLYRKLGESEDKVKTFAAEVISRTNANFAPLQIVVVLQRLDIWSAGDKTHVDSDHTVALANFKPYRRSLMLEGVNPDVTILLTNINFVGSTVGYALVRSMCSASSVAVVEARNTRAVQVAHTLSHELGHVLGMIHDEDAKPRSSPCVCKTAWCIMAAELGGTNKPTIPWSNCSLISLAAEFVNGDFACLQNIPSKSKSRIPFCGDGIVEDQEQCDCGMADTCDNYCCNATTCMLHTNATCASGPCCDLGICKPFTASTECRAARSECDLPEYCSGSSETCPNDIAVFNGKLCDDGQGYCHGGSCGSRRIRCETMFGPGAVPAVDRCYKYNVEGLEGRNCGRHASSTAFKKCHSNSVTCGSIYCKPLDSKITKRPGVTIWPRSPFCYTSYPGDITTIPLVELVPDGAQCGLDKICVNQECVAIPPRGCGSPGCGPFGLCNSQGRCHCKEGFSPPFCTTPGFGGSVDSGHSTDPSISFINDRMFYLVFLIYLPLISGFCVIILRLNIWWETNGKLDPECNNIFIRIIALLCCCSSAGITKFFKGKQLVHSNSDRYDGNVVETEELHQPSGMRRGTICQVDVNVQPPKPEPNSWGTANDTLFTDLITITPKNSPDMHRKVRLPSNSPLFHHKSQDQLNRPKYNKSFSTDSGCVSDLEEKQLNAVSMSSLVSIFNMFGKNKRSRENSAEPELPNSNHVLTTQKSMPLSRLVVDPYGPKINSKQGMDSSKSDVPRFSRSISSDSATPYRVNLHDTKIFQHKKTSNTSISSKYSSDNDSIGECSHMLSEMNSYSRRCEEKISNCSSSSSSIISNSQIIQHVHLDKVPMEPPAVPSNRESKWPVILPNSIKPRNPPKPPNSKKTREPQKLPSSHKPWEPPKLYSSNKPRDPPKPPSNYKPREPPEPPSSTKPREPPKPLVSTKPREPPMPPTSNKPWEPPKPSTCNKLKELPMPPSSNKPWEPPKPPSSYKPKEPPKPPSSYKPKEPPKPPSSYKPKEPLKPPSSTKLREPPKPPSSSKPREPLKPPTCNKPREPPKPPTCNKPREPPKPPTCNKPREPPIPLTCNKPKEPPRPPTCNKPKEPPMPPSNNKPWETPKPPSSKKPWEQPKPLISNKQWEPPKLHRTNKP